MNPINVTGYDRAERAAWAAENNMNTDPFAFLCAGDRTPELFDGYSPPERFPHAEWVLVGEVEGEGDGQSVLVFEQRWPATFFRIEVLAGTGSGGEPQEACTINTGSGMGALVGELVEAITTGMIGFHPSTNAPEGTAK